MSSRPLHLACLLRVLLSAHPLLHLHGDSWCCRACHEIGGGSTFAKMLYGSASGRTAAAESQIGAYCIAAVTAPLMFYSTCCRSEVGVSHSSYSNSLALEATLKQP